MCDLVPCLADMAKEVDSPDRYPLGNVEVPVVIKTGVVGMDKPSILPAGRAFAHRQVIHQHLLSPQRVIPKVGIVAVVDWRKSRRVDGRQGMGSTIQKGLYVTCDLVAAIAPRRRKNVRHQPAYLVTRGANTDIKVRDDLERCGDKMVESGHPQTAE